MLRPLNDRIIIELVEKEERTASGIFLPDTAAKEKPQTGEVIAVGPGKLNEKGERVAVDVKVGDEVLYPVDAVTKVKIHGEEVSLIRQSDVLAVID